MGWRARLNKKLTGALYSYNRSTKSFIREHTLGRSRPKVFRPYAMGARVGPSDIMPSSSKINMMMGLINSRRKSGTFQPFRANRFLATDSTFAGMRSQIRMRSAAHARSVFRGKVSTLRARLGARGAFSKGHAFFGNQYIRLSGVGRGMRSRLRLNPRLSLFRRR